VSFGDGGGFLALERNQRSQKKIDERKRERERERERRGGRRILGFHFFECE
jgi:hypothetical protein